MRSTLELPDGRALDYLELGDPCGVPAVYLHGSPSSASEARWLDRPARAHGVRLVAFDRPGYLGSAANPDGTLLAVAEDVVIAARTLGLDRFATVGFSGGAGYALVVAHVAGGSVTVVHMGGGIGPLVGDAWSALPRGRRASFALVLRAPAVTRVLLAGGGRLMRRGLQKRLGDPAQAARWFFDGPARGAQVEAVADYVSATPADELRSDLLDFAAVWRQPGAPIRDLRAYAAPWPFDLGSLATPVELWHGLDDPAVPATFSERIAAALPNAQAHLFPEEGHFVFHAHGDEIAASIRSRAEEN